MAPFPRFSRARRAALAAAGALAVLAACNGDPFTPRARESVQASGPLVVSALTGTGPGSRSALLLVTVPTPVSPENVVNADFHVVFDINAAGAPVAYPVGLVTGVAPRRVTIRRLTTPYDSLTRAPTGSYRADSALTLRTGEVVGVQVPGGAECQFSGQPYYFSKVVVDSVRARDRLLFVRATTNPNCGFRSFLAGVPTN